MSEADSTLHIKYIRSILNLKYVNHTIDDMLTEAKQKKFDTFS